MWQMGNIIGAIRKRGRGLKVWLSKHKKTTSRVNGRGEKLQAYMQPLLEGVMEYYSSSSSSGD